MSEHLRPSFPMEALQQSDFVHPITLDPDEIELRILLLGHFTALHEHSLYNLAYRYTHNREIAQDVVQDVLTTMAKLFQNPTFILTRPNSKTPVDLYNQDQVFVAMRAYIMRSIRNKITDFARRASTRAENTEELDETTNTTPDPHGDPERIVSARAQIETYEAKLVNASAAVRAGFEYLKLIADGYSIAEIANMFGAEENTIRTRIYRVRIFLNVNKV